MLWKYFLEFNMQELFTMWANWIPDKNMPVNQQHISKSYYVVNPYYEIYYDIQDEEYVTNGEDEFLELVDNGSRVTSFEDFVLCAYENSIP